MKAEDPWPVVNGRRKAPVGKLRALFNQLHQIRCCLCEEDSDAARQRFSGLYLLTRGNPCNGCFYWNEVGSQCPAFRMYHTAWAKLRQERSDHVTVATRLCSANGRDFIDMTVAEIAEELNISKSEVRRRKQAGTLRRPAPPAERCESAGDMLQPAYLR